MRTRICLGVTSKHKSKTSKHKCAMSASAESTAHIQWEFTKEDRLNAAPRYLEARSNGYFHPAAPVPDRSGGTPRVGPPWRTAPAF